MFNISFTEEELNMLLKGLYVLEDQHWFRGKVFTEPLIKKLNEYLPDDTELS